MMKKSFLLKIRSTVPDAAATGSTVNTGVQYTVLGPAYIKQIKITETRMLFNEKEGWIKLAERQVARTQGTYSSVFSFTVPKRISKGDAVIVTIISNDKQTEKTIIFPENQLNILPAFSQNKAF